MAFNARTDLAVEAREMYIESSAATETEGVEAEEESTDGGILITRVRITDKDGEKKLGKNMGTYITIDMPSDLTDKQSVYEDACRVCAKELSALIRLNRDDTVLVIGLGNWNITADALGPKTVKSVLITRHLIEYMPEEIDSRLRPVCAVSPGVLGITGVETAEIVLGLTERVKPSLIIAIDALCSRRMERVNSTIQITDTGITPGAGIGNRRLALDQKTLNVPVIAIGVPTVVDAATITSDTIELILEELKLNTGEGKPLYKILKTVSDEDKYGLIKEVLTADYGNFVVTPKEVDTVVDEISGVIANGINIALHEGVTLADIDRYR